MREPMCLKRLQWEDACILGTLTSQHHDHCQETDGPPMPLVVVADKAFQISGNPLKPYSSHAVNYRKLIFHYRLTQARLFVACVFGILTGTWRVFTTCMQLQPATADHVIKACVVSTTMCSKKSHCQWTRRTSNAVCKV